MLNLGIFLISTFCILVPFAKAQGSVGVFSGVNGDFNIGLVLPIHLASASINIAYDELSACGALDPTMTIQVSMFINMIEAINNREDILPGITLGYSIVDTCRLPNIALARVAAWGQLKEFEAENGRWAMNTGRKQQNDRSVLFAIGGFNSRVSQPLTQYLQLYDIPFIDIGATLSDLSDRRRYPLFGRTSPSDKHQTVAIAETVQQLGHQCVHLIASQGLYGELGAMQLREELIARNVCIATESLAETVLSTKTVNGLRTIFRELKKNSTVRVIVCFCEDTTIKALLEVLNTDAAGVQYQIIAGDYWSRSLNFEGLENVANGAISVTLGSANASSGVKLNVDELMAKLENFHVDPWMIELYERKFTCSFSEEIRVPCDPMTNRLTDDDLPMSEAFEDVYIAVTAGIQAIYTLLAEACPEPGADLTQPECKDAVYADPQKFYKTLIAQEVDTSEFGHGIFTFDKNGEGPATYTLNYLNKKGQKFNYQTLAIWDNAGENSTTFATDVIEHAKHWPQSQEKIASTCQCPL